MLRSVPNLSVAICFEDCAREKFGREIMANRANIRVNVFSFFIEVQGRKLKLIEKSIFAKFSGILRL